MSQEKSLSQKQQTVWNPFSADQWLAWIGATLIAGISVMIFMYSTFLTQEVYKTEVESEKDYYQRYFEMLQKRLDRIEDKIDHLPK